MTVTIEAPADAANPTETTTTGTVNVSPVAVPMPNFSEMSDEQIAAFMEQIRKLNASARQVAQERGIEAPRATSLRPLTASALLAAKRKLARVTFQIDRFTEEKNAADAEYNEALTRYAESNGFNAEQLPESVTTLIDQTYNDEYQKRVTVAAERSAPATADPNATPKKRGRKPKNAHVNPNADVARGEQPPL